MNKLQCLFLGYDENKTNLIKFLREKKIKVKNINDHLTLRDAEEADIVISFGYQKLIKKEVLKKLKRPAINLHMSFLPYNRGSYPNYWSFIEETPKGITIHEIDEGADTGDIIFQKSFAFDLNNEKFSTFKKTYNFLFLELEKLFIEKFAFILGNNYKTKKQIGSFSDHKDSDLPKNFTDWDTNIIEHIKIINESDI
jgi:methionyl-tRNA formyltransferase